MRNSNNDPNPYDSEDDDSDFGFQHLAWIAGLTFIAWLVIIGLLFTL